ncbi:hypothetical protein [Thermosynechococcus sp.]|uniref:hypothetical protein n=1 Tax=Thermosynechococcus sp. TaxID=2814275 RepID=UPI0037DD7D03
MHLAQNRSVGRCNDQKNIVRIEITTTHWHDSEVFPDLLSKVEGDISEVSADGTYDAEAVHAATSEPQVKVSIPPREEAVPWGNSPPRDLILAEIAAKEQEGWKEESGHHLGSLAENMMYWFKQLGIISSHGPLTGRLRRVMCVRRSSRL